MGPPLVQFLRWVVVGVGARKRKQQLSCGWWWLQQYSGVWGRGASLTPGCGWVPWAMVGGRHGDRAGSSGRAVALGGGRPQILGDFFGRGGPFFPSGNPAWAVSRAVRAGRGSSGLGGGGSSSSTAQQPPQPPQPQNNINTTAHSIGKTLNTIKF